MTTVLTPTLVASAVSSDGTLQVGQFVPVDASSGPLDLTLPSGIPAGRIIVVERVDSSTSLVTVTGTVRGASGYSVPLYHKGQVITFISEGGGSWRVQSVALSPNAPLAVAESAPSSTLNAYFIGGANGGSPRDVDATHLIVTFVVPDTGAVEVVYEGVVTGNSSSPTSIAWCVREGDVNLPGTERYVYGTSATDNLGAIVRVCTRIRVSGLLPGTVHTFKWGWRTISNTGGSSASMYYGGTEYSYTSAATKATMEIYPA